MKKRDALLIAFVSSALTLSAETLYVNPDAPASAPPFTSWNTAATTIQDAIDAAGSGDLILVTNGVYRTGGRPVGSALTNRVVIDKPVTVQSVSGPEFTLIEGAGPLGPGAIRCVYVAEGAVLSGFTLTNGATVLAFRAQSPDAQVKESSGGGAWCESTGSILTNCIIAGNVADYSFHGMGGGIYSGTLLGCTLSENRARLGGGAFGSVLIACTLSNNVARSDSSLTEGSAVDSYGGGAHSSTLTNCLMMGNSARSGGGGISHSTSVRSILQRNEANDGGGAFGSTLAECEISENSAARGGGVYSGHTRQSVILRNTAFQQGGGANNASIDSSFLAHNQAVLGGGGAANSHLRHCTVVRNSANTSGGGTLGGNATNSIVWHNAAVSDSNFAAGTFDHSNTDPLVPGSGNISAAPIFTDSIHLAHDSPGVGGGSSLASPIPDLDGDAWANPPAMGCDEPLSNASGPMVVAIQQDYANAKPGSPIEFTARIEGHASEVRWSFGDGTGVTNQPYISHTWSASGTFTVSLTAVNADYPAGVATQVTIHVLEAPILYVAQSNTTPVAPYLSWATAATNIQDAVDATFSGGALVLVSNGVYRTGGGGFTSAHSNRVHITKPLHLASVNGPAHTVIEGQPAISNVVSIATRVVHLCEGATLEGFTITNGSGRMNSPWDLERRAGGIFSESTNAFVLNCIVVSNMASAGGAGVFSGTIRHSQIVSNFVGSNQGGGAAESAVLTDCLIAGNNGGGALSFASVVNSTLSNCVVRANRGGLKNSTAEYCTIIGNLASGIEGGEARFCLIASNTASLGGGALNSRLENCTLEGNRGGTGGGAYNTTLLSCVLSNNFATNHGGGAALSSLIGTPGTNNLVANNHAGQDGGGLYIANALIALTNWTFLENVAQRDGGGLHAVGGGSRTLSKMTFIRNSAMNGGGAYHGISGAAATYENSTFIANSATTNGGGAYGGFLRSSLVASNSAANGGGAFNASASLSEFHQNVASGQGGGLVLNPTLPALLTNCTLRANVAALGGGLFAASSGGLIRNCQFTENLAITNGGGVYLALGGLVQNSTIVSNTAVLGGGAYQGTFVNSEFIGNRATGNGGAYYSATPNPAPSTNNLITLNWAGTNGGGIATSGGVHTWNRSQFIANTAGERGGAAYNVRLENCLVSDNSARLGGGVFFGNLLQCVVTRNRAETGGGAHNSNNYPIHNSTIVDNEATNNAGGVYGETGVQLSSSIVYFNSAPTNSNFAGISPSFSCIFPTAIGQGNITNNPHLVDVPNGNLRLQTNSPCIDSGINTANQLRDFDGRPRVVGSKIDMGAYEFQAPGISEFAHWLSAFGLPSNGTGDFMDTDMDRRNNWQEWIAGTNPTNALSVLKLHAPIASPAGVVVSWISAENKSYVLERSASLGSEFSVIQSNILSQGNVTTFLDAIPTNNVFYRVHVQ